MASPESPVRFASPFYVHEILSAPEAGALPAMQQFQPSPSACSDRITATV